MLNIVAVNLVEKLKVPSATDAKMVLEGIRKEMVTTKMSYKDIIEMIFYTEDIVSRNDPKFKLFREELPLVLTNDRNQNIIILTEMIMCF